MSLPVAIPPPSASLHLIVLVTVVLFFALLFARLLVAGVIFRASLFAMRPCVGPSDPPPLPPLREEQNSFRGGRTGSKSINSLNANDYR